MGLLNALLAVWSVKKKITLLLFILSGAGLSCYVPSVDLWIDAGQKNEIEVSYMACIKFVIGSISGNLAIRVIAGCCKRMRLALCYNLPIPSHGAELHRCFCALRMVCHSLQRISAMV